MLDIHWSLLLQVLNVLILMLLLQKLLFKPIKRVLEERESIIKGNLEEAKNAQEKAETALKMIEEELAQAKQKATAMLSDLREHGATEQINIIEGAKEQSNNLIEKSAIDIEKESAEAKKILKDDAEKIAVQITAKILGSAEKERSAKA